MSEEVHFAYVAIDARGRRVRGMALALDARAAHARLKSEGLAPVSIRPASGEKRDPSQGALGERATAELVADLAALLRAGADMRSALAIIAEKAASPARARDIRLIAADISGGDALDQTFARRLGRKSGFVAALAAAGEASGDLAGGLERAGMVLESRIAMREQIVSALSYPAFVFVTAIFGLGVILLMVVPSLAPLTEASGAKPGLALGALIAMSSFLTENFLLLSIGLVAAAGLIALGVVTGGIAKGLDKLFLGGPLKGPASRLVYGGFAVTLGGILAAGAQIGEAMRFAIEAVQSPEARRRLEPILHDVRQGEALSHALGKVDGMPPAIVRLAAIGEESGALGAMIARAGRLEEATAIRQIEALSRMIGPAMIVMLGALIGLLMAGLLSGITDIGEAAID